VFDLSPEERALRLLAPLYGAQTGYRDATGIPRRASSEALVAVLRALGAPLRGLADAPEALRARRQTRWQRVLPPVSIAWAGSPASVELHLPVQADQPLECRLNLEDGGQQAWPCHPAELRRRRTAEVEGARYVAFRLPLPDLPRGYHHLTLSAGGREWRSLVISAPLGAYPDPEENPRTWGVFMPLYALRSERSWGSGDLSDLEGLWEWASSLGASTVATLPLLAAFLDGPFEPSPYQPVSRLFWNELYADPRRSAEFQRCPQAHAIIGSKGFEERVRVLDELGLVDYAGAMEAKQQVLAALARCASESGDGAAAPEGSQGLADYARFRATVKQTGRTWPQWRQRQRDGDLRPGDYDEAWERYHIYAQRLMEEQLRAAGERARREGKGLHLDFPLGVHPGGYDTWRFRRLFVEGVSAGAPPDAFFSRGQDWGFPPLHPERPREAGYEYLAESLRRHMRHAGFLRIDHVMAFHRLFWIPGGMEPHEGVYIRYPAEEYYAVVALESQRQRCSVIGENLGTIPWYVGPALTRHHVMGMHVAQFELTGDPGSPMRAAPRDCSVALNTHDMATFAAFWQGRDIEVRATTGLLGPREARLEEEKRRRQKEALVAQLRRRGRLGRGAGARDVMAAFLELLAESDAGLLLVNLEDLWLEEQPQNVPGTGTELPNWRRKARESLEGLSQDAEARAVLARVAAARPAAKGPDQG